MFRSQNNTSKNQQPFRCCKLPLPHSEAQILILQLSLRLVQPILLAQVQV